MINANQIVGSHNVLFITLDALRYDVALMALNNGKTPNIAKALQGGKWEKRHTPGTFTYAAHHAFFAGFLPTPNYPGVHSRLFSLHYQGSSTTTNNTYTFNTPNIVSGFSLIGYRTICIGGVEFFNKQSPLASVLPGMFQESYWHSNLGIMDPQSTENQVSLAENLLKRHSPHKRVFMFLNISAIHRPNYYYLEGATHDTLDSQEAALAYVDQHLPRMFSAIANKGPTLVLMCSDHGTTYGEKGFEGHRIAHSVVWNVPYTEFILPASIG